MNVCSKNLLESIRTCESPADHRRALITYTLLRHEPLRYVGSVMNGIGPGLNDYGKSYRTLPDRIRMNHILEITCTHNCL
jgi:hypothetical protein